MDMVTVRDEADKDLVAGKRSACEAWRAVMQLGRGVEAVRQQCRSCIERLCSDVMICNAVTQGGHHSALSHELDRVEGAWHFGCDCDEPHDGRQPPEPVQIYRARRDVAMGAGQFAEPRPLEMNAEHSLSR